MEHIVELHLNEIGVKAIGKPTKTIYIDGKKHPKITKFIINELFPMDLVNSYNVKKSYKDAKEGDLFKLTTSDGTNKVVKVIRPYNSYYKAMVVLNIHDQWEQYYIKPDGSEQTRLKHKAHISDLTKAELNRINVANDINCQYDALLNILVPDFDDTTAPNWMTLEGINEINAIVDKLIKQYKE